MRYRIASSLAAIERLTFGASDLEEVAEIISRCSSHNLRLEPTFVASANDVSQTDFLGDVGCLYWYFYLVAVDCHCVISSMLGYALQVADAGLILLLHTARACACFRCYPEPPDKPQFVCLDQSPQRLAIM